MSNLTRDKIMFGWSVESAVVWWIGFVKLVWMDRVHSDEFDLEKLIRAGTIFILYKHEKKNPIDLLTRVFVCMMCKFLLYMYYVTNVYRWIISRHDKSQLYQIHSYTLWQTIFVLYVVFNKWNKMLLYTDKLWYTLISIDSHINMELRS